MLVLPPTFLRPTTEIRETRRYVRTSPRTYKVWNSNEEERWGGGERRSKRGENPITNYPRLGTTHRTGRRHLLPLNSPARGGSLHEYVNPYFRIECARNQKPTWRTERAHRHSALRGGIDLLAHSTYPRGDSASCAPSSRKKEKKRYPLKVHRPSYKLLVKSMLQISRRSSTRKF